MNMETTLVIVGAILAAYEVVTRVVPSSKDWTVVNKIIKGLRWLSDSLNRKK